MTPIAAELDGSGAAQRYYIWTPGGQLLWLVDAAHSNAVAFYHFDQIGGTLALTNGTGTVTDTYAYDPFGHLLAHTGTSAQPFTFLGQWGARQEGSSGALYHIRARYYDAATGRFVSREPLWPNLGDPAQNNPYQYAINNPVLYADFTGLLPLACELMDERMMRSMPTTKVQNQWLKFVNLLSYYHETAHYLQTKISNDYLNELEFEDRVEYSLSCFLGEFGIRVFAWNNRATLEKIKRRLEAHIPHLRKTINQNYQQILQETLKNDVLIDRYSEKRRWSSLDSQIKLSRKLRHEAEKYINTEDLYRADFSNDFKLFMLDTFPSISDNAQHPSKTLAAIQVQLQNIQYMIKLGTIW